MAAEPHVTLEPDPHDPVQRKLRGPLQEQLSSALQAATERVQASYRGESFDVVCRRLLDETKAGLHPDIAAGFEPDMDELAGVAVAIVRRA
ncbi:hypothetical protein SAMN05421812_114265 [Asanoa hainanensis]|uniref:Uncharacterized protein n=1 Tax=Asanoa hainanensis TaxID=560556 RepID=A0A239P8L1_9ACTN|nr:hypothetical protein [Asanoa hainanensis]SNT63034.1 hypothetical protein SAMN05421812_114265 [Asanoa hainanensis]